MAMDNVLKECDQVFRLKQFDLAFLTIRAGIVGHGDTREMLAKRYLLMLEASIKLLVNKSEPKKDAPPRIHLVAELLAQLPADKVRRLMELGGSNDATQPGENCVLIKDRSVMVVGLHPVETQALLSCAENRVLVIASVEDAVLRGLSQGESTSDSQPELKNSWNQWALNLCDRNPAIQVQLRCKCLLQRVVLLLQQQQHLRAMDTASEVLKSVPGSKHALALLATAEHKAGKKKRAAATLSELCGAFQRLDENQMGEELGYCFAPSEAFYRWTEVPPDHANSCSHPRFSVLCARHPLELTIALLVEMHRTKEAVKLLGGLLARVASAAQQHLFYAIARLFSKHGLNKDILAVKLSGVCQDPPDRRTWEFLKSMADVRVHLPSRASAHLDLRSPVVCVHVALAQCTPVAVEQVLQKHMAKASSGHFIHVPQITEVMCKLPCTAQGGAASKALAFLRTCAEQVRVQHANSPESRKPEPH